MHEHAQQAKTLHKFFKNFKSQEFIKILTDLLRAAIGL